MENASPRTDRETLARAVAFLDSERLRHSVLSQTFFVLTLAREELRRALGDAAETPHRRGDS